MASDLSAITSNMDPANFDPIDYINEVFPNEQSLNCIDEVILKVENEIASLDVEIQSSIRQSHNDQLEGEEALQSSQDSINLLVAQIQSIAQQAKQSEQTVREITLNMKQLDLAKRNLSQAISALSHLHELVANTVELEQAASLKKYDECAKYLQQVLDVLDLVNKFNSVPKIRDLAKRVADIKQYLIQEVSKDLQQGLFKKDQAAMNIKYLKDACKVLESALASEAQNSILDKLIKFKLEEYKLLYEPSQDQAWLDQINKRYEWATANISAFETRYSPIFPPSWHASERFAAAFCEETKIQLTTVMQRRVREIELNILWNAILHTLKFEEGLGCKYAGTFVRSLKNDGSTGFQGSDSESGTKGRELANTNPFTSDTDGDSRIKLPAETKQMGTGNKNPFHLLIGGCFEPHMDVYVKAKSQQLHTKIEKFRTEVMKVVQLAREPNAEINVLGQLTEAEYLNNATELFVFYKTCLVEFCKISTGRPLLGLVEKCFRTYLKNYSNLVLLDGLPGSRGTMFLKMEKVGKLHSEIFAKSVSSDVNPNGANNSAQNLVSQLSDSKKSLSQRFTQLKSFVKDKDVVGKIGINVDSQPGDNFVPLTNAEICFICKILGTADWCYETALQLEGKLIERINLPKAQAEKEVSFETETNALNRVIVCGTATLVDDIYGNCCDKVMMKKITRMNWETLESTGDTSPYIRECCDLLSKSIPRIRDQLLNQRRFFTRTLIDFVSQALSPNLLLAIKNCRILPPAAAETLLMDTYAMKNFLLNLPNVGTSAGRAPPASYRKVVESGMGACERFLQAILSPHGDVDKFIEGYRQLMEGGEDEAKDNLMSVLKLKGLKSQQQNMIIEAFYNWTENTKK